MECKSIIGESKYSKLTETNLHQLNFVECTTKKVEVSQGVEKLKYLKYQGDAPGLIFHDIDLF